MKKKQVIIFFGAPGSGKGTQSDLFGEFIKLPVISTGELLRKAEQNKTKLGLTVKKFIDQGLLVSDEIIDKLITQRLKRKDALNGFILDGYPRDKFQLDFLLEKLPKAEFDITSVTISVSDEWVIKHLAGRRVCACGASYHLQYNPPKKRGVCDLCGAKITIRHDDKPATIKKRLKTYHGTITPLLPELKKKTRVLAINGERDINKIQQVLQKKYGQINKK